MGGIAKLHPMLATAFFISAFSMAGLPPLSGFWAKFGLLESSIDGEYWWTATFILVVSFFTLLSMIKIWLAAFWQPMPESSVCIESERSDLKLKDGEHHFALWAPCFFLAGLSLLMGIMGSSLYDFSVQAATDMLDVEAYRNAVLNP
jgi:multicomponent Na+:H+ antiporter subunit D